MNRWGVYEALKGTRNIDIKELEKAAPEEIKEGVIEFLISRNKGIDKEQCYERI